MESAPHKLIEVLQVTRALLVRPGNDFTHSRWADAAEAVREIDGHIAATQLGALPERTVLEILFAPTGAIQEVGLDSGWGRDFLAVAERFDNAAERVYGPR